MARKVRPAKAKEKAVIPTSVSKTPMTAARIFGGTLKVKDRARPPTVRTMPVLTSPIVMLPAILPSIQATLLEGVTKIASTVPISCSFLIPLAPDETAFIITAWNEKPRIANGT